MEKVVELSYALDTFYFLISGALVMPPAGGAPLPTRGTAMGGISPTPA